MGRPLNSLGESVEALPKTACCAMHLEFLQASRLFLIEGFFHKEI